MLTPTSIDEIREAVREQASVRVRAGGTKTALSGDATLSLEKWAGILEYNPSEFTFTARAGTTLREVQEMLGKSGQYLPFDPPLVERGATLGGTIASGLSGPGRFRYGGVRDFILGMKFVTGDGELHSGGGKVVKNAAGFDFPKLMVGALGRFGVLTEVTFKVFPQPHEYRTIEVQLDDTPEALSLVSRWAMSQFELTCLEFLPPGRVVARVGGRAESLLRRVERIVASHKGMALVHEDDAAIWNDAREFGWRPAGTTLIKVAIPPSQMGSIESLFAEHGDSLARRYSVGGNLLWLAWPDEWGIERLTSLVDQLRRPALAIIGAPLGVIGPTEGEEFLNRLTNVFDPLGKFARFQTDATPAKI